MPEELGSEEDSPTQIVGSRLAGARPVLDGPRDDIAPSGQEEVQRQAQVSTQHPAHGAAASVGSQTWKPPAEVLKMDGQTGAQEPVPLTQRLPPSLGGRLPGPRPPCFPSGRLSCHLSQLGGTEGAWLSQSLNSFINMILVGVFKTQLFNFSVLQLLCNILIISTMDTM